MRSFKEIKANYYLTKDDEKRLIELRTIMEKRVDKVVEALHQWINSTESARKVFRDESLIEHVMKFVRVWFLSLFSGKYDNHFYDNLIRIGQRHEKVGVETHFMTRAINIIRNTIVDILGEEIESIEERKKHMISVNKILDINLDIMISAYVEEEVRGYSATYRVKSRVVWFSEIFAQITGVVLIVGLILLSGAVVYLCGKDIYEIFTGKLEQAIVSTLGSFLILWVMLELINTQIALLRGGKFKISVFVGVALVTIIRELMIAPLKHESIEFIFALVTSVLVIGITYWLVKKTEEHRV